MEPRAELILTGRAAVRAAETVYASAHKWTNYIDSKKHRQSELCYVARQHYRVSLAQKEVWAHIRKLSEADLGLYRNNGVLASEFRCPDANVTVSNRT